MLLESGADHGKVREIMARTLELARTNLIEARRSVLDLRAVPLENRTLPEALRALLEDDELKASLDTHCEVMGSGRPIPMRVAVGLYRIAQEAINNVRQHANATMLEVELMLLPDRVQMIVRDDGVGFDPSNIPEGHFGLVGLNERAKLLGGQVCISSTPGMGTIIDVTVPLDKSDE
jgi:two-component system NarL family sensor kinase